MNAYTKTKLSQNSLDELSPDIQKFISEHAAYFEIKSDSLLCDQCDYLFYDQTHSMLKYHSSELGELAFDFAAELSYHRAQKYALSKEPLARALGLVGNRERIVWDATCGTGKDALLISVFGAKVYAFERNPAVYVLLLDAKRRASTSVEFIYGDSSRLSVEALNKLPRPEVIYYDPMFPEKQKKSALPRKEMQIFKTLIGPDEDSQEFLKWAKTISLDRVVVKRPLKSEKIHLDVNASYEGKSTRYDMYKIFSTNT